MMETEVTTTATAQETKVCKHCGRELPASEFSPRGFTCKQCVKESHRRSQNRWLLSKQGLVPPPTEDASSDEELDTKQPREVIDLLKRCARWLKARDYDVSCDVSYTKRYDIFHL